MIDMFGQKAESRVKGKSRDDKGRCTYAGSHTALLEAQHSRGEEDCNHSGQMSGLVVRVAQQDPGRSITMLHELFTV